MKKISVPDATIVHVASTAVQANGEIVIACAGRSQEARVGAFFVFVRPDGTTRRVVRTSPFAAIEIVALSDGRIAALGRVYDERFNDVPGHRALRVYSPDGVLLHEGLPRAELSSSLQSPLLTAKVAASQDLIGILDRAAQQYLEIDLEGNVTLPWTRLSDAGFEADGLTMLDGQRFFTGVSGPPGQQRSGLYVWEGAGSTVAFRQIDPGFTPVPGQGFRVIGVQDGKLALHAWPPATLYFSAPPPRR